LALYDIFSSGLDRGNDKHVAVARKSLALVFLGIIFLMMVPASGTLVSYSNFVYAGKSNDESGGSSTDDDKPKKDDQKKKKTDDTSTDDGNNDNTDNNDQSSSTDDNNPPTTTTTTDDGSSNDNNNDNGGAKKCPPGKHFDPDKNKCVKDKPEEEQPKVVDCKANPDDPSCQQKEEQPPTQTPPEEPQQPVDCQANPNDPSCPPPETKPPEENVTGGGPTGGEPTQLQPPPVEENKTGEEQPPPPTVDCKTNPSDPDCKSEEYCKDHPTEPQCIPPEPGQPGGPDQSCKFDPDQEKCKPDEFGNCPKGWFHNEDDHCVPPGPCPKGFFVEDDDETGRCQPTNCPDGQGKTGEIGGKCVPCPKKPGSNVQGCPPPPPPPPPPCPSGQERFHGVCVPKCPPNTHRLSNGACERVVHEGGDINIRVTINDKTVIRNIILGIQPIGVLADDPATMGKFFREFNNRTNAATGLVVTDTKMTKNQFTSGQVDILGHVINLRPIAKIGTTQANLNTARMITVVATFFDKNDHVIRTLHAALDPNVLAAGQTGTFHLIVSNIGQVDHVVYLVQWLSVDTQKQQAILHPTLAEVKIASNVNISTK
jgi:hypothetical protein